LCLPGSHDAGVYRDFTQEANPGSMTCCQHGNIYIQALVGSRVFDIRVFLAPDWRGIKTETPRKIPTMGHFFKETEHGRMGEYGGTLMSALRDAARFLAQNPSEFLIFRIGHTQCMQEVAQVLKDFRTAPKGEGEKDDDAKHRGLVIHTGAKVNLADLEYQQLKGKLLLVFDNLFMSLAATRWAGDSRNPFSPRFSNVYGYYPYDKYPFIPLIGLSFCGEYAGGLEGALTNHGNWTSETAEALAHVGCKKHAEHRGNSNHLLWVYWQRTGGNILENTTAPQGMHARLPKFLNDLSTNGKFARPNVIGHDFVTKETCASIVKLNPDLKDTSFIG